MRKVLITFLLIFSVVYSSKLLAQSEFAPLGSYWLYSHEPHDGNGFGWDKIKVTKDTVINGENLKILERTYYRQQTLPPLEIVSGKYVFGYLSVENDSVFINDQLIFDFGAEEGDTLDVFAGFDYSEEISLVIDSVSIETIDGADFKSYYGNKFCLSNGDPEPYQEFLVIETIGAIGTDFFSWNSDGCILGGGTATFNCYRHGFTFNYPESSDCVESFLSTTIDPDFSSIKVFPNPVENELTISNDNYLDSYSVQGLDGVVVVRASGLNSKLVNIDLYDLSPGVYIISITSNGKSDVSKFIKN